MGMFDMIYAEEVYPFCSKQYHHISLPGSGEA
jgi:hypothetical protein